LSFRVVIQFQNSRCHLWWRHPDRSRFSGGGRDLARSEIEMARARSLSRLKCAVFRDDAIAVRQNHDQFSQSKLQLLISPALAS
jgi:hypothetical protein